MPQESNTQRALNSIADLLLTGPAGYGAAHIEPGDPFRFPSSPPQPTDPPAPIRERLELVMVASVPGYPAPWLNQYARELFRESGGPVAFARFQGKKLELEIVDSTLLTPEAEALLEEPLPSQARVNRARVRPSTDLLRVGLDEVARTCRGVLLHSPGLSDEAIHAGINRWTVLTAADDEAVVAAYRVLKECFASPKLIGPSGGVRLVFVGCDEPAAREAFDRIGQAAGKFLEIPLGFGGVLRRLEPVRCRSLGMFECEPDAWTTLRGAWMTPTESPAAVQSSTLTEEEVAALTAEVVVRSAPQSPPSPAIGRVPPIRKPPQGRPSIHTTEVNAVQPKAEPSQAKSEPISSPVVAQPLSKYIPGLVTLQARCPRQPGVELGLDLTGGLHLLAEPTMGENADQTIRRLLEARLWVAENRELLALTCPERRFAAAEPVIHLFTSVPKHAAALAFAGPAENRFLRLHLLKPVALGEQMVVVHEELN